MKYNIGDFIYTHRSNKPALIVSKNEDVDSFLISIHEYGGDYMWIYLNDIIEKLDLKPEEKLSIVSKFGNWFYDEHKLLYQELIIENLVSTFSNDY